MLTYSFTNKGSDSLYIHLYKCIKKDILSGNLTAGSKLPSKRSFAKNLGISTITVENAYAQLQSEGYIYSLPKKGFYVMELTAPELMADGSQIPPDGTAGHLSQNHSKPPSPLLSAKTKYTVDLTSNKANPDNFPFSIWAKLIRETISEKTEELVTTPPCGGIMELREAICAHLKAFRGMAVAPEQVIIGAGTEYLYGLIIKLLGFDKAYAIENPGYPKLKKIYHSHCVNCEAIPLDREGIQMVALEESGAQVAHITPSHHFPTGIVTSISRRYELLGWAAKKEDRYIIEDDYDSEFRLSGKPIPSLQSIDHSERVIYINTFTKSLASTVRLGYMVLPGKLLEEFYQNLYFYSCTVSNFEQYTLAHFLSGGYFEKHINRMRTHYRSLRNELLNTIKKSPLSSRIHISEEDAGLHFLMRLDTEATDEELAKAAIRNGLHITCLSEYYFEYAPESSKHTIVLNYSGLELNQIPLAVELLSLL